MHGRVRPEGKTKNYTSVQFKRQIRERLKMTKWVDVCGVIFKNWISKGEDGSLDVVFWFAQSAVGYVSDTTTKIEWCVLHAFPVLW